MDVIEFVERYPTLYHMAERNTWPAIKQNGLLSTTASLDRYAIESAQRESLEKLHRPDKVAIGPLGNQIVLRDQKPMEPSRLAQALEAGLTPTIWYKLLNGKVFFWAQEHRLQNLLKARHYRSLEHDVLTIDTASLVAAHEQEIWLCPMNSGNTFPIPHRRGESTFRRIADYPMKANGVTPIKEVVEVVVDHSVVDISTHVVEVRRMKGDTVLADIPL